MSTVLLPRNDFVLIKVVSSVDKDKGGVLLPQISKELLVEAIGPDVQGLEVGDKILMEGTTPGEDFVLLPGFKNLVITKQSNVMVIVEESLTEE